MMESAIHTTHATFYVGAAVCVLVGCEICVGRLATCIALVTGLMIGVVLTLLVQVCGCEVILAD